MTRLFIVAFMGEPRSAQAKRLRRVRLLMTVRSLCSPCRRYSRLLQRACTEPAGALRLSCGAGVRHAGGQYRVQGAKADPLPAPVCLGFAQRGCAERFWFDEMYQWLIDRVQENLAKLARETIDRPGDRRADGARYARYDRIGGGACCAWPRPEICRRTPFGLRSAWLRFWFSR
ncbi:MAG: hypothetical protein CM1200mP29_01970 [Verrucomicrobiota bacterium]|nr:MAG: hypothetical protein CM1200mP29_01970 [Verrucomicrobiota bacterium]